MTRTKRIAVRKTITRIIAIQFAFVALIALIAILFADVRAAYSAVIGGGISIIATGYFASQVFSVPIGASAVRIAKAFYIGEAVKLILTAVLFIVAILWLNISFLPAFLAYAATLLAYWLILPFSFDTSLGTL